MLHFLTRVFGSRNERLVRGYGRYVRAANELEPQIQALSDAALRARTDEFRARLKDGAKLDDLLPEAFAVVREAARRTLKMRHFDVQLVGGISLHEGKIAEMRTGEGKTLVSTLPAYLNALPGNGVHIVTVNEYLAQRDADWMSPIYRFLGLTVGVIKNAQNPTEKRQAYACDITYGTNNEFGFDYLRDNLAFRLDDKVQRGLSYAIVDEVDSILIDEARTPLIISGPAEESTELYLRINQLVPRLKRQPEENAPGDFLVEEKSKQVHITEDGHEHVEALMFELGLLREGESLYEAANIRLMHHLNAALRAHALYKRDVEYIVRGGEVIIVDEFTGRTMPGRRWSDGLHQAVEAKEGVRVREENQTVASITFQNYFRLYTKLAGMTGTADTEAPEFLQIYGLEVVVIPTHRPMIRKDMSDFVYLTQKDKFQAIIEDIRDCVEREQPVLVGTTSIETSEFIAGLLQKEQIPHEVLNAKQHEREAQIVAQAGRPAAVTIATNMAGRGTDIVLGGNLEAELTSMGEIDEATGERVRTEWQARHDKVLASGGLHIIGTERHESRRIDNQLRGRSGRQGDPGSSRFYLAMEDNLMRIFGDPMRTKRLLQMAGMKEGEVIESGMLTRQIEKAQRKVESHNFDIRKQLLLFDDVANDQRKVVYQQRTQIMGTDDLSAAITGIMEESVGTLLDQYMPKHASSSDWDLQGLSEAVLKDFNARVDAKEWLEKEPELDEPTLRARLASAVRQAYEAKVARVGTAENGVPIMRHVEKDVMLNMLDRHWREHLGAMDYLRQGIHLRGYAQKDYRFEYKREAFELFAAMLDRVKFETVSILTKIEVRTQEEIDQEEEERRQRLMRALQAQHAEVQSVLSADGGEDPAGVAALARQGPLSAGVPPARGGVSPLPPPADAQGTFVRSERKIGRNEPCPCGSGKKYKHCHGVLSGLG
ncbi:MAG: preprotein translocase subunit SecA [Steroidobacteraceae bacterium]